MFTVNTPSANVASIRAGGYSARVRASFFKHKVIATGTVVAPVYPQTGINPIVITDSYTFGAYTDVQVGMRLVITDASGNIKGETYIRDATISAFVLPVPEYAQAKLNYNSSDEFIIYDEFRLNAKIVGARASFPPDLLEHTDEGSNPPPRILTGGAWAGNVDDGTAFASVPFDYTESRNTDPDSTPTDVAFETQTQTGVAVASGYTDTDDQLVLEIDASATAYTITTEGTDTDNSKVTLRRTPVMVHSDAYPAHEVVITSYEGTQEGGFNFTIEVIEGDVDIDTIPEGCLCVLWTDERYDDEWASFRNRAPGREHIIGVGYIRRETLAGDENGVNTTTFEVESYQSVLKSLTSYSKVMEENATPDAWSEVKTLGVIRAAVQLPMFYSNLLEVSDVHVDSDVYNPRYPAFYLQRSNFYDQLKELLDGVDAVKSCDRSGRMMWHTWQPYVPLADRAGWDVHYLFIADDVITHELSRNHFDPVEQYKTSGISGGTSGNSDYYSLYPGHAPGTGVDAPTRDRLIVVDQDDLNERTGRYGALADDVFMDANGVKVRGGELRLTLRGSYNFLDFGKHYYAFDEALGALDDRLGDITDLLWYLTAVSWSAGEQGEGETQATFRVATNAAEGESFFPPTENYLPIITTPPPPIINTTPGLGAYGISRGAATLYAFDKDNACVWKYTKATGTWALAVDLTDVGGSSISGTLLGATWRVGGNIARLVTTTEQRRLSNYSSGTPALGSATAAPHTSSERSMQYERSLPNWGIVVGNYDANGVKAQYTTNDTSWSNSAGIPSFYDTNHASNTIFPGLWLSPTTPGLARIGVFTATGNPPTASIYQTTDYGANFSLLASITLDVGSYLPGSLVSPFQYGDGSIAFYGKYTVSGVTDARLIRSRSGSAVDISPDVSGERYGPPQGLPIISRSISVADDDPNSLAFVGIDNISSGSLIGVFLTRNAINASNAATANWQQIIPLAALASMPIRGLYFVDRQTLYMAGTGGAVKYWDGVQVIDISIPSGGEIVALMGA